MGVLAALHHRDVTGDGQLVEVNMVQGALDLQLEPFTYQVNGGTVQRPTEPIASSFHEGPYGFYETVDGFVALSLSPIAIIAAAIGEEDALAEFADRSLAFDRRDDIHRALAPILRSWSTDGLVERLRSRGVWCSPVNDYKTALEDPIVANVDPVMVVDHPEAGSVTLLRHPITYGSWNPDACELPPMLGEHTDETLARLGYTADAIEDLRRKGII
jgi:crotonobetainyl-CoA:carnitine CoA-transferase CaiB-like acyl-CoA transferase